MLPNTCLLRLVVLGATGASTTVAFSAHPAMHHVVTPDLGRGRLSRTSRIPMSAVEETETQQLEDKTDMISNRIESFNVPRFRSNLTFPLATFDQFNFKSNGDTQALAIPTIGETDSESPEDAEEAPIGIWAARALLVGVAMLWGTNFAAVKYLETLCFHPPCSHLPSEAAFARFGVAALASIPLLIGQRKDVILAGVECGFWITFGYITQAMALQSIGAGECAFICSLTVVVVPLLSSVFFGKEIKPVHVASAAVALTGVGILEGLVDIDSILPIQPALADSMTTVAAESASSSTHVVASSAAAAQQSFEWFGLGKGDLLALGQPFGFGCAFMRIEHYVEKFKDVKNRVLTISAAQCVIVGLLSLLWVLYDFHGTLPSFDYMLEPHRLAAVGWTGIMTTVVAIYLEGVALQTASATEAALTFSSEPVWASLFGLWLLHEQLDINAYVGGAVILTACIMGALADLPGANDPSTTTVDGQEMS